jgi:hypothetical protein
LHIGGSALAKSVDVTQRIVESGNVTNINDRLRPGDVAGIPVNNMVTQVQEELKNSLGYSPFGGGFAGANGPANAQIAQAELQNNIRMAKTPVLGVSDSGGNVMPAIQRHFMKERPVTGTGQLTPGLDRNARY